MTVYPSAIDDDRSIIRIDENLSEMGGLSINQIREAIFALEKSIGTNPFGSKTSVTDRLAVSINDDGTIRATALSSVGLVTLPITNNQVGTNAGIEESKLTLSFSTSNLNTRLLSLQGQVNNLSDLFMNNRADLTIHITGGQTLTDHATAARHVASQIDINQIPYDTRDAAFHWTGLVDKNGFVRTATQVASALQQINDDLVAHETATANAHVATAVSVDESKFTTIYGVSDVQGALEFLDDNETKSSGMDRATMASNGILRAARGQAFNAPDGYHVNIIPYTPVAAFLAEPAQLEPRDSITNGDNLIRFYPTSNTNYSFDSMFANVVVGDILRIKYGNGYGATFTISSIRVEPGLEWVVRINGTNLVNADGYQGTGGLYAEARIDRPRFETNTRGDFAVAIAPPNVNPDLGCTTTPTSVIVGSPRGAMAVGVGFDPNKLNTDHYALYLRIYPSGNPSVFVDLPAIDVTGNLGTTPGHYNLDIVVEETNKQLRRAGYNYRFISFAHKGEFGIMLADAINAASFSIITGTISGTQLVQGSYIKNVVGDATDGYDALGLGATRAGYASPAPSTYTSATAAAGFTTIVIPPVMSRNGIINGVRRDFLAAAGQTGADGSWQATITNANTDFLTNTRTVQYTVNQNLSAQGLIPGKTIVVQPLGTPDVNISDYGRFIIGYVSFSGGNTVISVINGIHGTGNPVGSTLPIGSVVKLFFSNDSVSFDGTNLSGTGTYHRYHEIFIDQNAHTFSIERARMEKLGMTALHLDTNLDGWRIRQVSPKLTGVRTDSSLRHFVRFVISKWDQASGEFEGYLADPDGTNVTTNVGPTVIGKKNHPVRFYDNSHVNFIDIEYRESDISPGVVMLPDSTARYADIELFPSMTTDDEAFLLAGVSHNDQSAVSVTDLREFGTVSERNFTDSAIKFIESGERYLHANGIIRGFEYKGAVAGSLLSFSGGLALVNGKFVAIDSGTVKIPDIHSNRDSTIELFICATDSGQMKAVIKSDGQQMFTTDNYWAESLTFQEIVDRRKDLAVFAKATVTFSGNVPSTMSIADARRFVNNESINEFTWSNDDGYAASFRSTAAIQTWVDEYGLNEVKIKYIKITDTPINLLLAKPLKLVGGVIEIVGSQDGLILASDGLSIDGAKFYYYPTQTGYVSGDIVNAVNNQAGLKFTANNITIENCTFTSNVAQHPPFIGVYSTLGSFRNIAIKNNKFNDIGTTYSVAIGFINTNPSAATKPSFYDVNISGNVGAQKQIILLSSKSIPVSDSVDGEIHQLNSLYGENVTVARNTMGAIGFCILGKLVSFLDNTADVIASGVFATMHPITKTYGLAINEISTLTSNVSVRGNMVQTLKVETTGGSSVVENKLIKGSEATLTKLIPLQAGQSYGITVLQDDVDASSRCACIGNTVEGAFDHAIHFIAGGSVTGNIIHGIAYGGYGIYSLGGLPNLATTITGNTIQRGDTDISAYILADFDSGMVIGNVFDKYYVSGVADGYDGYGDGYDGYGGGSANYNTIMGAAFAAHNINQTVIQNLNISNAVPLIGDKYNLYLRDAATSNHSKHFNQIFNDGITCKLVFDADATAGEETTAGIYFPIEGMIPRETFVLRFAISWAASAAFVSGKLIAEFNDVQIANIDLSSTTSGVISYASNYLINLTRPGRIVNTRNTLRVYVEEGVTGPTQKRITLNTPIITWAY